MDGKQQRQRHAFLYFMALVYMFAFGSWLVQIPGLYGNDGLLPIKNELKNDQNKSTEALFVEKPTIIWFLLLFGYSHQTSLELLCLLGTLLSFLCLIFRSFRCMPVFATLWFLYFSLFQVGQTFSWFQWDTLLLESGFLSVLVSPIMPRENDSHYHLPLFLVQWLLFRLMFASGVVKLTSMCPTWWGLTALNYHFETQCIPTPMAWWAHQLPKWFLKLGVVGTYLIEIALPFLFFAPIRRLRLIGAYGQVLFMFSIMITGNYNFFNLLTIALCFSIFDEEHINFITRSPSKRTDDMNVSSRTIFQTICRYFSLCTTIITIGIYNYLTGKFFGLKLFEKGHIIFSKIQYTKQEFIQWTDEWTVNSIWIASVYFIWVSLSTFRLCLKGKSVAQNAWSALKYTIMLCVCVYMFCISMVPFNSITSTRASWPIIQKWHSASDRFQLVHSYGLFRSMTGVGGRPEVILEGMSESGPWKEIPFLYKPGNTTKALPWLMPHQPRLDWQMWFAALGSYQHNIWLVNLVNKLFLGQTEVLQLLDVDEYPFKENPPKFIRASLYHYHFTLLRKDGGIPKKVWTRKHSSSYLPVLHKDHKEFKEFLKYRNLITKKSKSRGDLGHTEQALKYLRQYLDMFSAPVLLWALWLTAIIMSMTKKYIEEKH